MPSAVFDLLVRRREFGRRGVPAFQIEAILSFG